jgi:proline dehydrogenase
MLRSFLIYLSKAKWAQHLVTRWNFSWRAASRFIAGERIEDAILAIKNLNAKGINATLDHLGEHTTNEEEARRASGDILLAIDAIEEAGVRANVSIKLTQIGLALGEEICAENLKAILTHAKTREFCPVDMEDFTCVEKTPVI